MKFINLQGVLYNLNFVTAIHINDNRKYIRLYFLDEEIVGISYEDTKYEKYFKDDLHNLLTMAQ